MILGIRYQLIANLTEVFTDVGDVEIVEEGLLFLLIHEDTTSVMW